MVKGMNVNMQDNLFDLIQNSKIETSSKTKVEKVNKSDIAIVGLSAILPGAKNIDEYWNILTSGINCATDIPDVRRKDIDDYMKQVDLDLDGRRYVRMSYIDEVDKFDYKFFNISPMEAKLMDPNQRILLQTIIKAVEDAGYGGNSLSGSKTAVFIGYRNDENINYKSFVSKSKTPNEGSSLPGNLSTIIANRISYILDLKGPSMYIDTACSSSLVAVHLACNSIRNGESDGALVAGVRVNLLPIEDGHTLGLGTEDGITKAFDDNSNGTGWGEGVIALFLKPLSSAIEDRNHIYAVIKGSAVNQNGKSAGITAPDSNIQTDLLCQAWKNAKIEPESISYIEAHGTGTNLGDPIELAGIKHAFEKYTDKKQFCAVGSVKSNLGHLDGAAGLASVVKMILALQNKKMPATLFFEKPNQKEDIINSPIYINTICREWEDSKYPRRCGISAFGMGGANAHIILEEAPCMELNNYKHNQHYIFVLSAKSINSLKRLIEKYYEFTIKNHMVDIADICYTAALGRGHFNYRIAIIIKDTSELQFVLNKIRSKNSYNKLAIDNFYYGYHKNHFSDKTNIIDASGNNTNTLSYLNKLCELYVSGAEISWKELYKYQFPKLISLPTYEFDEKRCWVDIESVYASKKVCNIKKFSYPFLDSDYKAPENETIYTTTLDKKRIDNKFNFMENGDNWFCNEIFLEIISEACNEFIASKMFALNDIEFVTPLIVKSNDEVEIQTVIRNFNDKYNFDIFSRIITKDIESSHNWIHNVRGQASDTNEGIESVISIEDLKNSEVKINTKNFNVINVDLTEKSDMETTIIPIIKLLSPKIDNLFLELYKIRELIIRKKVTSKFSICYLEKKYNLYDIIIIDSAHEVILQAKDCEISYRNKLTKINTEIKMYQSLLYTLKWTPTIIDKSIPNTLRSNVLIFLKKSKFSENIVTDICKLGKRIYKVYYGVEYKKLNEFEYIVSKSPDDYFKLFSDLKGKGISDIIHMFSVNFEQDEQKEKNLSANEVGILSVLYLTRAIGVLHTEIPLNLLVLVNNSNYITKLENYNKPFNNLLQGFCNVLKEERSEIQLSCVDIDINFGIKELLFQLYNCDKSCIAYRNKIRYTKEIGSLSEEDIKVKPITWKQDGIYIITGGLGEIGMLVAAYLADKYKINVALIGRTSFPAREKWNDIVAFNDDDALSKKIRGIYKMEHAGCKVEICSADVSDEKAINSIFEMLKSKYGSIHGIIHCAGISGWGLASKKTETDIESVLLPKVEGSLILDKVSGKYDLDFIVLFSSITTLQGVIGQSDYAAANSFLNSFSAFRMKQKKKRTISISWPAWYNTGMSANHGSSQGVGVFKPILPEVALKVMDIILNIDVDNIIVGFPDFYTINGFGVTSCELSKKLNRELKIWERKHFQKEKLNLNENVKLIGEASKGFDKIDYKIGQIWADVLGQYEIDIDENFYEMGGDSILAISLFKQLERNFPDKVEITDIFSYPTVHLLSKAIHERILANTSSSISDSKYKIISEQDNKFKIMQFDGLLKSNCYLVIMKKDAIIVDPGMDDCTNLLSIINDMCLNVRYIMLTHGHFDHIYSAQILKNETNAIIGIHTNEKELINDISNNMPMKSHGYHDQGIDIDLYFNGGESIPFQEYFIEIVNAPGHTSGSICIRIGNNLFTGDTLFKTSIGRPDSKYGSQSSINKTIKEKIALMDKHTFILPGHGDAFLLNDIKIPKVIDSEQRKK